MAPGDSLGCVAGRSKEERKVVSVLFCDLVGFTAAAEEADPEDVRGWLAPYHELLKATVERFGGTVEKFAGDAILAVFGAPVSHEDDAERAIRAGLAILEELPGLPTEMRVRIGINTGEALVDVAARPEAGEAFVTGTVVNAAARLQSSAPVGAVVVGEATYRATARVFDYTQLEPVTAKGLSTPLNRWQAGTPRGRFGAEVTRNLAAPLVGRERDLLLLRTAFDKAAEESVPQFVTVAGEPGIGKSRLVAELARQLEQRTDPVTWRESRCLPYGDSSFRQLTEIVNQHAGILDTDAPDTVATKLDAVLPDGPDTTWMRSRILPLLNLGTAASQPGAQPDYAESFEAWRLLVESFTGTGPAVVVVEDLHWADDALLSFVDHLADRAADLPLLIIGTARPELLERHSPPSRGLTINLSRLSGPETDRLVTAALAGRELPGDTRAAMVERSGGNPLYAEELARMLGESGHAGTDLPEGIAAIIAARLDALAPRTKAVLADASVVGAIFWAEAVAAVGGTSTDDVIALLHELTRKELVRPLRNSSMEGRHEYAFRHVLVREVAYGQLPRAVRAARHVAVADWLEGQHGAPDMLAYHLGTAYDLARATGDPRAAALAPRAREYLLHAAERAMHLDANQATALLDRARALTGPDDPDRGDVLALWAWGAFLIGRQDEAQHGFRDAIVAYETAGDTFGAARALRWSSYGLSRLGDIVDIRARVVRMLEPLGPSQELVHALASQASIASAAGDRHESLRIADLAIQLAAEQGYEVPCRAVEARGLSRLGIGDTGGMTDLTDTLTAYRESGEGRNAAITWLNYGWVQWQIDGPAAALATLEEAREFGVRRGLDEFLHQLRCAVVQLTIETGRLRDTKADCLSYLALGGPGFTSVRRSEVLAGLARVEFELGEDGAGHAEAAYELALRDGWPDLIAVAAAPVAQFRALAGDRDGVREVLEHLAGLEVLAYSHELPPRVPALVRASLAAGLPDLGRAVAGLLSPTLPMRRYAGLAAEAFLTDDAGLFQQAVEGWVALGNELELAHTLRGLARCTSSAETAAGADELFAGFGVSD